MDIDEVYREYGEFGSFQQRAFWSVALMTIFMAFQQIQPVFVAAEPQFFCQQGKSRVAGCSHEGQPACLHYEFSGDDFTSIVSEWSLVCDEAYKSSFVQSAFMAGILIGSLLFGHIGDRYGRRRTVYVSVICIGVTTVFGSMATTFASYLFLRHMAGIFCGGFGLVSFILVTELCGPSKRSFVAMVIPISFAIGIAAYAVTAYYVRGWRQLSVVTAMPCFIGVYYYLTLPESPRWLLSQGRRSEAEQLLEMLILRNTGRPPARPVQLKDVCRGSGHPPVSGLAEVFNHPILRARTINNFYTWFVNCAVYYGLTMGASSFGGDRYASVVLSGLIEIPAYILSLCLLARVGRRPTYFVNLLAGGVFCFAIVLVPPGHPTVVVCLSLLGKMAISVSFSVAFIYAAEMYPTSIRNKAVGVCNMAARVGGIVAPLIMPLGQHMPSLPFIVFGLLSLSAGLLAARLPETAGKPMPETTSDLSPVNTLIAAPSDKLRLITEDQDDIH